MTSPVSQNWWPILLRRRVAVIVTPGSDPAALVAKAVTTSIPIVFSTGTDPVQKGLVVSLNRPGGNVTGVTALTVELGSKRLDLLHQMLPGARRIALLTVDSPNTELAVAALQTAAAGMELQLEVFYASNNHEIDIAFSGIARQASWCDPAGGRPAQVRGGARLVASVAWSLATVAAKRTQQLRGVWD
jgi:putative ABC transport system substrate-binding protein